MKREFLGGKYRQARPQPDADEIDLPTVIAIEKIKYEYKKAVHDQNLRAAERAHDFVHEYGRRMAEAAGRNATETTKVALAINGGSAIAIMTFLGAFAKDGAAIRNVMGYALMALACFAAGVACSALTAGFTYFANLYFGEGFRAQSFNNEHPYVAENDGSNRYWKKGDRYSKAAIRLAIAAFMAFVVGVIFTGLGLAKLGY
jgi:hypothetical protein